MIYKLCIVALALISLSHAGRIDRSSEITNDDMLAYKLAMAKIDRNPFEYQDGSKQDRLNHIQKLVSRSTSMSDAEKIILAHYTGLLAHAYDEGKFGGVIDDNDLNALRAIVTKTGLMGDMQAFRSRLSAPAS